MDTARLQVFLQRVLELQLRLADDDIRSQAYFHGQINRLVSETLLKQNGQFLVRESGSQKQQFVLSCLANSEPLHFMIHEHKTLGNPVAQYYFDGDLFDSIPAMIDHYRGGKLPITKTSQAIITESVNRKLPLNHIQLTEYFKNNQTKSTEQILKEIDLFGKFPDKQQLNGQKVNDSDLIESSEYLKHIQKGTSAIQLEEFCPELLLSPDRTQGVGNIDQIVCEIISETGPNVMASHLFKRDLKYIGLNFDASPKTAKESGIKSGIELMVLPVGKQMRKDIIIRHECLKYFVLLTIVKANDLDTMVVILEKWIKIAAQLITSFGDFFAFGSIMSALCHERMANIKDLWNELQLLFTEDAYNFEMKLKPQFYNLVKAKEPLAANITFPFVIQLCHLIECDYMLNAKLLPLLTESDMEAVIATEAGFHGKVGLNDFSLDDVIQHMMLSNSILDNLDRFEENAKTIFDGFFFKDNSLDELFKTAFHLRFLFNKNIEATKVDHEEFQKVELIIHKLIGDQEKSSPEVVSENTNL